MAYAVYSFASQYTDTGQIGIYVGTREDNVSACLEIASEQIADIAGGNVRPDELERAKENLKGRIMLSMESTSNRMSRLGKSLITDTELLSIDRIIAEIDAVEPDALAELAGVLLAPEQLSAAGIGPQRGALPRGGRARQPRARARRREGRALRPRRQGRLGARAGARGGRARAASSSTEAEAMVDFTAPGRGRGERARGARAGRAVRGRHERLGPGAARRAGARSAACALFFAPNFAIGAVLMMRLAAEAARYLPRAEIVELHERGEEGRAVGHGARRPPSCCPASRRSTRCGCRASSRTRRCCSAARASC